MTHHVNRAAALLAPYGFAGLDLKNRIAMASMTRGRARNASLVPSELHVEYYRQRASAGLIFSEAIWINRDAIGTINVPGLFSAEQVEGWRAVTDAVHAAGGRMFAQVAHSGAVSHPDFHGGALPMAPSPVNPGLLSFTSSGFKDTVTPRAMTLDEIKRTVEDYGNAARNAREAGFDGVELHAATTYLMPEFLNSRLNVREDVYGGSAENRARIVVEALDAMIAQWGAGKVGLKIGPTAAMGGFHPTAETVSTFDYLVSRLNQLSLSHLQVSRAFNIDLASGPVAALADTIGYFRPRYHGVLIANAGYDMASAQQEIAAGRADMVSMGAPFIGNPDLVARFTHGIPLSPSSRETYYQGGREGYIDYPAAEDPALSPAFLRQPD